MSASALEDRTHFADAARPHDLLWISGIEALSLPCAPPEWVEKAIAATPVVVLRREASSGDEIPVGVRGRTRSERLPASVALHAVRRRVTPEDLAERKRWREIPRPEFAAIGHALQSIAVRWRGLAWGPAGSVGFELATGAPVTTCESDLDLVIHAPQRISRREAEILLQSVVGLEVRTDVRIETPFGSVALQEYASPVSARILMRTCTGPMLIADPWTELTPLPVAP